jgi:hypothetical protein
MKKPESKGTLKAGSLHYIRRFGYKFEKPEYTLPKIRNPSLGSEISIEAVSRKQLKTLHQRK